MARPQLNPDGVSVKGCSIIYAPGVIPLDWIIEYDHHLGYGAANHETVQPVCSRCHHRREDARGASGTNPGKLSIAIANRIRTVEAHATNKTLANKYNVAVGTIGKIKRGETWVKQR